MTLYCQSRVKLQNHGGCRKKNIFVWQWISENFQPFKVTYKLNNKAIKSLCYQIYDQIILHLLEYTVIGTMQEFGFDQKKLSVINIS